MITDIILSSISSGLKQYINKIIKKSINKKKMFINIKKEKKFLTLNPSNRDMFISDLDKAFTDERISEIVDIIFNEDISDLNFHIRSVIQDIFHENKIDEKSYILFINNFINSIFNYIRRKHKDKYKEFKLYEKLDSIKTKLDEEITIINKRLKELEKSILKKDLNIKFINDYDNDIKSSTKISTGLDFFIIDDSKFLEKFSDNLKNSSIIKICGVSKREVLFRVLNYLSKLYPNESVLIVEDLLTWNNVRKNDNDAKILIPFLSEDEILPSLTGTTIIISSSYEKNLTNDYIQLRKCIRENIIKKLEELTLEEKLLNEIKKSNLLFIPLYRKLHNSHFVKSYHFQNDEDIHIIRQLILLGGWNISNDSDHIIKHLNIKKYKFQNIIEKYSENENPIFIFKSKHTSAARVEISCVDDVWGELFTSDSYVEIDSFIITFERILNNNQISPFMKFKMFRSLIILVIAFPKYKYLSKINLLCEEIIINFIEKNDIESLTIYSESLSEIIPEIYVDILLKTLSTSTLIQDYFNESCNYTKLLFAFCKLVQLENCVKKVIEILCILSTNEKKHQYNNSAKSLLIDLFQPWINQTALTVKEKLNLANSLVMKYDIFSEVITKCLPTKHSTSFCITSFDYREGEVKDVLYTHEVSNLFIEYFMLCINYINSSSDIVNLLNHLSAYSYELNKEFISSIKVKIKGENDIFLMHVKNKLRSIIYYNRYYKSSWETSDEKIYLYVDFFNSITLNEEIYEYSYIFKSEMNYHILNPIQYETENNDYNINRESVIKDIKNSFKIIKSKKLDITKLMELEWIDSYHLGTYLLKYFSNNSFDEEVLKLILRYDNREHTAVCYSSNYFSTITQYDILENELLKYSNYDFFILSLFQYIPFFTVDDIKKVHNICCIDFKKYNYKYNSYNMSRLEYIKLLKLYLDNDKLNIFLECIYNYVEYEKFNLTNEELFELAIYILKSKTIENYKVKHYALESFIKKIHQHYKDTGNNLIDLVEFEMLFIETIQIVDMLSTLEYLKKEPKLYVEMINIFTDDDNGTKPSEFNPESLSYKFYIKLWCNSIFCPAEKNGKVNIDDLINWIESYKKLLIVSNRKSSFSKKLGSILANAPSDDNILCLDVMNYVEQFGDQALIKSIIFGLFGKRGVYSPYHGLSSLNLSKKYREEFDKLKPRFPKTSKIFKQLADSYEFDYDIERTESEDGFI